MTSDQPPLVDESALRTYLEEHLQLDEDEPRYRVQRHQEGHSNETFFVDWGSQELVLRRPPRGAFLPTAHDVLREHRILTKLEGTNARTPRPLSACDDGDVIGAPFYLMERIEGQVVRYELPEAYQDEASQRTMAHELVDALAELHGVDWEAHGLEGIGKDKGKGYLERQVARWKDQWERTRPRTEEVRGVPELDEVGAWLKEHVPETPQITVVHGDYKVDNVVYRGSPPRLEAILDWEMATLGDPLADLGWMLSFWREAGDPTDDVLAIEPRVTEAPGFPSRSDLVARYEKATGIDARNLRWYVTLATWKLAILLEGSYARHLAGETDDPFFEHMDEGVPSLARRALAIARGDRSA